MFELSVTQPQDDAAIEDLLDAAFGANRKSKTSYRYRQGVAPVADLSFVARAPEGLLGSIAYYPVRVGNTGREALLLGPLAVDPTQQGRGIGASLIHHSLAVARGLGHGVVLLVGDPNYYSRFGFSVAKPTGIWMADENPDRVQFRELQDGALAKLRGEIRHWGSVRRIAA